MTNDELCYTIMCIEKIENEQNQQSLSMVELEIFSESLSKTILNERINSQVIQQNKEQIISAYSFQKAQIIPSIA